MPVNGSDHATKSDIKALDSRVAGLEGRVTGLDGTVHRMVVHLAGLTGEVAELKDRIPPKSYFSKLMELLDKMAKGFEDQGQRLAGQASLWQDHEQRIRRLESKG